MPILACAIIKYSLQHGNLPKEATLAFATFGMLKIFQEDDYESGRYWGDVVRSASKKHRALTNSKVCITGPLLVLCLSVDIWSKPAREISQELLEHHNYAFRTGQMDDAMFSLQMACRYSLHGGDSLALLTASAMERLQLTVSLKIMHIELYLDDRTHPQM